MPNINTHVKRAPQTDVDGKRLMVQPLTLCPSQVRDRAKEKMAKGSEFSSYGFTVVTSRRDNKLIRSYFGYNGQEWESLGVLTGSSTSPQVLFEK